MRAAFTVILGLLVLVVRPAHSADLKLLSNVKGEVAYQRGAAAPRALAPSARVALIDGDSASTAADSLGKIVLSDATTITIGENSTVKMDWFHAGMAPGAKFTVASGKVRFKIAHPANTPSNYTFKTPTGQIAVRGTIGDLAVNSDDELQLNIYELGFARLPVLVTFRTGEIYAVKAGEALDAAYSGGRLRVEIRLIDQLAAGIFDQIGGLPSGVKLRDPNSIEVVKPK